jgi:hypothetical protein
MTRRTVHGEPCARDDAGAFGADVVTALRDLAEMIDQRLQLGPFAASNPSPWSIDDRIWSAVDMPQSIDECSISFPSHQ